MKPFSRRTKLIAAVIVFVIFASAAFMLWSFIRTIPRPIPRNIMVSVGGGKDLISNRFELNGSTLTVIRFPVFVGWDEEFGAYSVPVFDWGSDVEADFGREYAELIDWAVLNKFAGSLSVPWLLGEDEGKTYIMRGTVALSQKQLEYVWLLIDCVVRNSKQLAPRRLFNVPTSSAFIDGEVYWSEFAWGEYFRTPDFQVPGGYRSRFSDTDMNLLRLTHHLIDLSPILTGWE